MEITSCFSCDV